MVDLDGALDRGDNLDLVARIANEAPGDLQVGGGIRDDDTAAELLATGADRIIVGTRAVDDPAWLSGLADRYPDQIMVAADMQDGRVLRRGWSEASELADLSPEQESYVPPLLFGVGEQGGNLDQIPLIVQFFLSSRTLVLAI